MGEKKLINLIKKQLRNASRMAPNKNLCIKNARTRVKFGGKFKNGKYKMVSKYTCVICSGLFDLCDIQVDHIEEVGPFGGDWNVYISRLFCDLSNLQALCKECHAVKTKEYNKWLRKMRLL